MPCVTGACTTNGKITVFIYSLLEASKTDEMKLKQAMKREKYRKSVKYWGQRVADSQLRHSIHTSLDMKIFCEVFKGFFIIV